MKIVAEGQGKLIQAPNLQAFREFNRVHKTKELLDKRMTEKDAIAKFVNDGDYIGIELYGTVRAPMSLVREMIRQNRKNLRCAGQGVLEMDMLAAAAAIKELDWTYIGLEVYGLSASLRRAVESGQVTDVVEWSNAALSWRFKAAAMGLPHIPSKVMLGTDTFKYSAAKAVKDPFTGDILCLLPALICDVGLIHVSRADKFGNAQIDGISGFAAEMARASKRLIISAEEIVDTELIREKPEDTVIPYFLTDAVVEAPFGSHPGEMAGYYERDEAEIRSYYTASKSADTVGQYLQEWVYGVKSHQEYLDKAGREKLAKLKLKGGNNG